MSGKNKYPKILIRSKNELVKRLSQSKYEVKGNSDQIDDVLTNFDKYWRDSSRSEPEKGKYVRNAKETPLGFLLEKINVRILSRYDSSLPNFIFGGLTDSSHVKAGKHLLGRKRYRTLLKLDIKSFFEHISDKDVESFFSRCGCEPRACRVLSKLCCVPTGPKGGVSSLKSIGRGFATSSRLAVWCNLDAFIDLNRLVQRRLRGRDPRISVYVDDIGITASRVSKEEMEKLRDEVTTLLASHGLDVNPTKTKITSHEEGMEILGLRLGRNKLEIGAKTRAKRSRLMARGVLNKEDREDFKGKIAAINRYKNYVARIGKQG